MFYQIWKLILPRHSTVWRIIAGFFVLLKKEKKKREKHRV
ncbi:hypothetical protein TorRG33x02_039330 [Trema orientale]|uniref:Uncharacterized protein n=1 Tax=Trema orientale TaxID=63057 RepID=A0A2P5FQR6_TREOI|nr:hypothetical protein TorRG33x02_039330 [Trema orientale]